MEQNARSSNPHFVHGIRRRNIYRRIMAPKGKSIKGKKAKGKKRKERDEEEGEKGEELQQQPQQELMDTGSDQEEIVQDVEDEEEGLEGDDSYEAESTGKTQKENYNFDPTTEQRLVEFFSENDYFYNKGNEKYSNAKFKKHMLETLARELNTSSLKISKWFTGQRTTVGKLLHKPKSGSKAKALTARQKWQLANFTFLRDYIRPRTHSHDTGELPQGEDDEGDDEEDLEGESQKASTSLEQCTSQSSKRTKGSSTNTKMEDALLSFLQRPRKSELLAQKMQEWDSGPPDDKQAFGNWFLAKMLKIPEERWDAFEDEAHALVTKYTRQKPMQQPPWFQTQQLQWCQPHEQMQQQYQPQQRQQFQWSQPQHSQWSQPLLQQAQNRTQPPLQQWVELQRHPQPQELSNPPRGSGSTDLQQDPLPEPVGPPSSHSAGNASDILTQSYMVMLDPAIKTTPRRSLQLQTGSSQSGSLDTLNQSVVTQEERKDKHNNKDIE